MAAAKHVLTETNYCATMFEHRPVNGRYRCTAAGRYIDTNGRVICERCAKGLVVTKLTAVPKLLQIVDQLLATKETLTDELRAELRTLVAQAPREVLP
jgi:hypothetical protein